MKAAMKSRPIGPFIAITGLAAGALALLMLMPGARPQIASAVTPNPLPSLVSCPNVDGSADGKVAVADILAVLKTYPKSYGQTGYGPLWDLVSPYNSTSPSGTGTISVVDIIAVVSRYNETCPAADTQVARATRAIGDPLYLDILCDPALATPVNCGGDEQFLTEDEAFLESRGYYQGSTDVPGQGIHYVNLSYWDGVFNPTRPEGLVYNNGLLTAQLYVVDGTQVGWGTHEATSWPPPGVPHQVGLEAAADGPQCSPACSWDGTYDGWHMHYFLCSYHIGTGSAIALPGFQSQGDCSGASGGEPECTVPVTTTPCYRWSMNVGWMGHLWNWLPNANLIPDIGASGFNGRFADCFPDGSTWGPFNCPA